MYKKWIIGGGIFVVSAGLIAIGVKLYFDKKKKMKEETPEEDLEGHHVFEEDEEEPEVKVNPVEEDETEEEEEETESEDEPDKVDKVTKTVDYTNFVPPEENEEDEEENEGERLSREHLEDAGKEPEVISGDEVGSISSRWDQETLYFYQENGALVDESNEELKDPYRFVGACIEDSGFVDDESPLLFVKNYQLDTLYTIQKIRGEFRNE